MYSVRVSTKGQVIIPAELRKKYQVETNSIVEWVDTGHGLMLIPLDGDPINQARGLFKNSSWTLGDFLREKRQDLLIEETRRKSDR